MQTRTKSFWEKTSKAARKVADFQAKVILTILYILVALPTGLVVRVSEDALSMRRQPGKASHWRARHILEGSVQEARRLG
ncbi:MAG: hypothetical protein ACK4SA_00130 [Caldilinea sp.]